MLQGSNEARRGPAPGGMAKHLKRPEQIGCPGSEYNCAGLRPGKGLRGFQSAGFLPFHVLYPGRRDGRGAEQVALQAVDAVVHQELSIRLAFD